MAAIATAVFIDLDHLSYGDTSTRGTDSDLRAALLGLDRFLQRAGCEVYFRLGACSTATLAHHQSLLVGGTTLPWCARTGIDGADHELLHHLAFTAARGRARRVVLVGGDHIYAPGLRRLSRLGVEPWLLGWRQSVSADLRASTDQFLDLAALTTPRDATGLAA